MSSQLPEFINKNLAKGVSKETIYTNLLKIGWKKEDLDKAFAASNGNSTKKGWEIDFAKNIPLISLRIGLAFIFLYAAIFVSGDFHAGAKYVPSFVTNIIPLQLFLIIFGIFEVVLALWILSGKLRLYSGLLTALLLIVVTAMNLSFFSVLFRNIAIIGAAIAFAFL